MSELDATRRERLTALLRRDGQAIITTTELEHVPGAEDDDVEKILIRGRAGAAEGRGVRRTARGPSPSPSARSPTGSSRRRCWRPLQRAWPAAAGSFARTTEPVGERDGVVSVACDSAVVAHELDLMSELVVERLNAALGRPAVKRLRTRATRT